MAAFLRHVSRGQLTQACELVDQPLLDALEQQGGCPTSLTGAQVTAAAERLRKARVDEDRIRVQGDSATLERGAVTVDGRPLAVPVARLVRHDGRWWITTPG